MPFLTETPALHKYLYPYLIKVGLIAMRGEHDDAVQKRYTIFSEWSGRSINRMDAMV